MSQKVIVKGNLEYRERANPNGTGIQMEPVLLRCPACGVEFKAGYHRASHIAKHEPEHFGLTPLRT